MAPPPPVAPAAAASAPPVTAWAKDRKKERSQELEETLGEQILYAVFFTQADFFLEILQDLQVQLAFWDSSNGGL